MNTHKIADDEDTARRALDVITILNTALDTLADASPLEVDRDVNWVFYTAFGWWASITRSSQAVAILHQAGLGHESAPIVRSILQHTLVLQWLVDVGDDAVDAIAEYGDDNTRLLLQTMADANWRVPDGISTTPPSKPAAPHPLKNQLKHFDQLCIAYGARQLYVPFRLLSSYIHPSSTSAMAYIDDATGTLTSHAETQTYGGLIDAARCLIQAGHIIGPLLKKDTLRTAVTRAEEQFGAQIGLWQKPT